jgi:hypothetical protein
MISLFATLSGGSGGLLGWWRRLHRGPPSSRSDANPGRSRLAKPTLAYIYEDHAEDCIRVAARTDDPEQRDVLLHLAIKWREDAEALRCQPLQWSLKPLRIVEIYEDHADEYIRTAARANDAKRRDVLLDLATAWRERASALRHASLESH